MADVWQVVGNICTLGEADLQPTHLHAHLELHFLSPVALLEALNKAHRTVRRRAVQIQQLTAQLNQIQVQLDRSREYAGDGGGEGWAEETERHEVGMTLIDFHFQSLETYPRKEKRSEDMDENRKIRKWKSSSPSIRSSSEGLVTKGMIRRLSFSYFSILIHILAPLFFSRICF